MKTRIYTVNDNGMTQIHQFLAEHHKNGGDHFDRDMVRAWAADAEFQLSEGNPASIEIPARDAVSGHAETFTISAEGLDFEEVELDD